MRIEKVVIIGRGALGIMYGEALAREIGFREVAFLADAERVHLYRSQHVISNGRTCPFRYETPASYRGTADLVLFAVKCTQLDEAIKLARPVTGPETVIVSVLNGIVSEEMIEKGLGKGRVVWSVAQSMDALKRGTTLVYSHIGELCLGLPAGREQNKPALLALEEFFTRVKLPFVHEQDIMRRMWAKWMLNVGVNQTVMVARGDFSTVQKPGPVRDRMIGAMREVQALATASGISITEDDVKLYVGFIDTFLPNGMPSMRQDGLAKRRSEVEFFAGTVIAKARKLGVPVPINEALYREVKAIEATYPTA